MALNLANPTTDWTDAATYRVANATGLTVQVDNGPVYFQLYLYPGDTPGAGNWLPGDPGAYLKPGIWNYSVNDFFGMACGGIRFKLVVPAEPAVVSAY